MDTPITGENWGDVIEPVREHLLREAERPFAELRPRFTAARQVLLDSLGGVSEAQAAFRPASGEGEEAWGIAEVLRHIGSIEVIMADRIRALGLGEGVDVKPTYPGYMEDLETRRLPDLRQALGASQAYLLAAIDEIEGHERLDTVDAHRRFGELNCRSWLVMHCLHMEDHARQIGRIKQQPGYFNV